MYVCRLIYEAILFIWPHLFAIVLGFLVCSLAIVVVVVIGFALLVHCDVFVERLVCYCHCCFFVRVLLAEIWMKQEKRVLGYRFV